MAHTLCRDFSKHDVLTLMINFENLAQRTNFYRSKIVRPLIVVMLKTVSDVTQFIKYTENMNKAYPIWLVIFADEFGKSLCKYCSNTMGNIFNLRFDTEMLTVCCGNPILEEWWSVHPNRTEIADFAIWNKNDGLTVLAVKGLFARRHDVNGTGLRVGIVTVSYLLHFHKCSFVNAASALSLTLSDNLINPFEFIKWNFEPIRTKN